MKITYTLLTIAVAAIGFTTNANAQSSATATATATLITPISIVKSADMNFGSLAALTEGGTATLSPAGVLSFTGVTKALGDDESAASFNVEGAGNNTFSLSFPSSLTLTSAEDSELTLTITSDAGVSDAIVSLTDGAKVINFGGTLTIPPAAVAGIYANETDFTVSVQYN